MRKLAIVALLATYLSFAQESQNLEKVEKITENLLAATNNIKETAATKTKQAAVVAERGNVVTDGVSAVHDDARSIGSAAVEGVSTLYKDFKSLGPEAKELVTFVANKIGATAESLWDILVFQQYVWSTVHLIVLIITCFGIWRFNKELDLARKDTNEIGEIKKNYYYYIIFYFFVAVAGSWSTVENLEMMLTGYINPEFGAIRTIIQYAQTFK